jgi:prepilin-type N-terminal cleavage/methylation domain-containing protein
MNRRGMTLVEMMVATAATLLLMSAIAQIFSVFGTAVSDSRSVIDLDGRMRSVAWRLRSDLDGVTAGTNPPLSPEADEGYFEVIEGPNNDQFIYVDPVTNGTYSPGFDKWSSPAGPSSSDDRVAGDTDDVLLFTTRNAETEFLGKFDTARIESPLAEVAWFLRPTRATANPTTFTLYRRQLLVVGYVGAPPFYKGTGTDENQVDTQLNGGKFSSWTRFYNFFDLSVRGSAYSGGIAFFPNTLGDLTRRESRFMHNSGGVTNGTAFPYRFVGPGVAHQSSPPSDGLMFDMANGSTRISEDVVLTNVIGFDVRVFDPAAPVCVNPSSTLATVPGDSGFANGNVVANGCYVDLGNGFSTGFTTPSGIGPRFASFGAAKSELAGSVTTPRVWDSWSSHYETNGFDEDNISGIDQGTNGLDDNANGVVDEPPIDLNGDGVYTGPDESGELETSPPYPFPLRGIEVRIRCYEPSSRQVRQMTVRQTLMH